MQWVLSGYALTFEVVLVAAGRADDIMGRGGIFLVGVGLFTVSSVAAGLASDAICARDWFSGLVNPQDIGMIHNIFVARRAGGTGRIPGWLSSLDPIGSVLLGFTISAILYPFIESRGSAISWSLLALGLILVWVWMKWEQRCARLGHSSVSAPSRCRDHDKSTDDRFAMAFRKKRNAGKNVTGFLFHASGRIDVGTTACLMRRSKLWNRSRFMLCSSYDEEN